MALRTSGGTSSVNVMAGGTAQLAISAYYNHRTLEISPEDVIWSVDPQLGTIDASGLFTASGQAGSGTITAVRGNTRASIQVTVEANHPFSDLDGHWAEAYMGQLYQQKVLTGEAAEDGKLYAYPERSLSRAEFSVLLARYLGIDTAEYAGTATPFKDLQGVGPLLRPYDHQGLADFRPGDGGGGLELAVPAVQRALVNQNAEVGQGVLLGLTEAPEEGTPGTEAEPDLGPETEPGGEAVQRALVNQNAEVGQGVLRHPVRVRILVKTQGQAGGGQQMLRHFNSAAGGSGHQPARQLRVSGGRFRSSPCCWSLPLYFLIRRALSVLGSIQTRVPAASCGAPPHRGPSRCDRKPAP